MTTSPASATVLEPMTIAHSTRDLVASILHAHASILHAPAPPLTSAELHEAWYISCTAALWIHRRGLIRSTPVLHGAAASGDATTSAADATNAPVAGCVGVGGGVDGGGGLVGGGDGDAAA